jgi:hypothetical protein
MFLWIGEVCITDKVEVLSNILVQDFFQLILIVAGILVSIVVFFIKQLLTRINETNTLVIQLDKKIALLVNDTASYAKKFEFIDKRLNTLEKEVWKRSG